MYRVAVFMCLYLVKSCNTQYESFEGASCSEDGVAGICTKMIECISAIEGLRHNRPPKICAFSGLDPIVCCVDKKPTTEASSELTEVNTRPQWMTTPAAPETVAPTTLRTTPAATVATTVATTLATTTVSINRAQTDFEGENGATGGESKTVPHTTTSKNCPPIAANRTAPKTGQKAWDKCIEYQEQLVMPCDATRGVRANYCQNDLNTWIINGEDAYEGEFPHMALVGYGTDRDSLSFLCGGTLISDRFVMTAGHCISSRDSGPISYVLLGVLQRSRYGAHNLHAVRAVHRHPQYAPPKKYNDIALLQLETPVTLSYRLVPACLDVGDMSDAAVATATGWGTTQFNGMSADTLQKVDLTRFTEAECRERFQPTRLMARGYDNNTQICYGDKVQSRDTCQGDSGGPLQARHGRLYCMYAVLGVTSLGRLCGAVGEPALYTRVAHYVPWIESVVWPEGPDA